MSGGRFSLLADLTQAASCRSNRGAVNNFSLYTRQSQNSMSAAMITNHCRVELSGPPALPCEKPHRAAVGKRHLWGSAKEQWDGRPCKTRRNTRSHPGESEA